MNGFVKKIILFLAGGAVYSLLEILFRGYTHWTMAVAGGLCLDFIYLTDEKLGKKSVWLKCLAGSGIITVIELVVGVIVNLVLGWRVWDYSAVPLNILGQICPIFSAIWYFLTIPALWICSFFRNRVFPLLFREAKSA